MSRIVIARWQDWPGEGLEHLVLREAPEGVHVEAMVLGVADGQAFAARYRFLCDGEWRTRRLQVTVAGRDGGVELSSDTAGHWTDRSGAPLPGLAGAIDVDLTATPFTNTLPIRRLRLPRDQSETVLVVYVRVPDLTVTTEQQRYTCLEPGRRYRFESVGSDFTREIEVDDDGLVVIYPGLFRRVL
jgi:hypothetical protein